MKGKRILSILITLCMIATNVAAVFSASTVITPGGGDKSGTGWTWNATTYTLTLAGNVDIPSDEITFSGNFNAGSVKINFSNNTTETTTPSINFSDVTITGGSTNSGAIVFTNNGGTHDIILNFTGTNTISALVSSTGAGGAGILKARDFGSITINGSVNINGGNNTGTSLDSYGGFGLLAYNGDVVINATGPINITGGNSNGGTPGACIYTNRGLTINGTAAVNITGGNNAATGSTYFSCYANDVTLNNSNTTIRGGNGGGATGYGGLALRANGSLTINKAVTITGGDFNGTGTAEYYGGGYAIMCKGPMNINGTEQVRISGGNSTGAIGNGGSGIYLYNTGSLIISNPNAVVTGGNSSGSGTKLGYAGSAIYINNATQTVTLPYSSYISNLAPGTGNTNGSKIFIGSDYFSQSSGKYNTYQDMQENGTQIIFTGAATDLTSITTPTAITGLVNGVAKTAAGLTLPSTVSIVTTRGTQPANVTWNVDESSYNAATIASQIFTVNGTVTLPDGVTNTGAVSLDITISVTVDERITDLISITAPTAITGLVNGAAKTAAGLTLPSTVSIVTTTGTQPANVTWDVAASSYNAATITEQTFTVNGTVTLPDGVTNTGAVPLNITISVTVVRGYTATAPAPTPTPTPTPTPEPVIVIVNGVEEKAALAETTKVDDKTVTTVTLDDKKIMEKLNTEGNNSTVTIPISNKADVAVGQLSGQTVKNMEQKEAVLEIKTENITYNLPAAQINIDSVSDQIGKQTELKDIKVSVTIADPGQDTVRIVENTANKNSYQVVVKPVEFDITCTSGSKTVEVSKFNGYVERTVAIPDGIDPSKITTGVVLNEDGTFSHVPTTIVIINGKYYAKINSLTNSTYSIIYNALSFTDIQKHWARKNIENVASRLIMDRIDGKKFMPDIAITRGEFVATIIKGLGLSRSGNGKPTFKDVSETNKYYDVLETAFDYKIALGNGDGTFKPDKQITREEAMLILFRAMKITKINTDITDTEAMRILSKYKDGDKVSVSSQKAIAICIREGILLGNNNYLTIKQNITRAQTALVIERVLKKAKLI